MIANRSVRIVGAPRMEWLEGRLLLSADALGEPALAPPAGTFVGPALEAESDGGPANDDLAAAEELTFSWLLPRVSTLDGHGPRQAAVLGTADGTGDGEPYVQSKWVFALLAYPNAVLVNFTGAVAPSGDAVLAITASADLGGTDKYLTLTGEGLFIADLFVHDELSGVEVSTEVTLDQAQLAALAEDGVISLTFTASAGMMYSGTNYMTLEMTYPTGGGAGTSDFYRFDLAAGESAAIAMTAAQPGQMELEMLDAAGAVVATGQGGYDNVAAAIAHFSAEQDGTYYLRVAGDGEYALLVNRNATQDLEDNGGAASAQTIDSAVVNGRQWAVGYVGGDAASADSDFYAVTLGSKGWLRVEVEAPRGSAAADTLAPVVRLYDAQGHLVAGGQGASLRYRAPRGGQSLYYVEVSGEGTAGEYVMSVKGHTTPGARAGGEAVSAKPGKAHSRGSAAFGRALKGLRAKPGKAGSKSARPGADFARLGKLRRTLRRRGPEAPDLSSMLSAL